MNAYAEEFIKKEEHSAASCKIGGKRSSIERLGDKYCLACLISKLIMAGALLLLIITAWINTH